MTRKYGHLPRQVYEYMPDIYDVVKKYARVSPYIVIGEMFGISRQRAQQVVLQERERQAKQIAVADAERTQEEQLRENPAGHQPGTFQPWNPHPK